MMKGKEMKKNKTTYLTSNGAANLKLDQRDYLIQQNWVNDPKGHFAMNSSL